MTEENKTEVEIKEEILDPVCEDLKCPIQQFEEEDEEDEELMITHVLITKSGEAFYANKSIELEEQLPNGDIGILVAIDALNYPEKGDRSIITIDKANIDFTHEYYYRDHWETLMRAAFCSKCEAMNKYMNGMHGIYQ
jgi:hypothetical protein